MKIHIFVIVGLMAMTSVAIAQVDTMRLLEVGSVTAPGPITNWYFEDLNGDSIKEIILTTANSVNIYSGSSFSPIWSQCGFTNPKDLNFADINNDGLIDFSVGDSLHIYLVDPHHSTVLWTSTLLDSLFRCYTIGDIDEDSWIDVGIVTKTPYDGIFGVPDTDTVWVDIKYGPTFQQSQLYYGYSVNLRHAGPAFTDKLYDIPGKLLFTRQLLNGSPQMSIFLFITKYYWYFSADEQSRINYDGKLIIFHPGQQRYFTEIDSIGRYYNHKMNSTIDSNRVYVIGNKMNYWQVSPYVSYLYDYYYIYGLEDDGHSFLNTIWSHNSSNSRPVWAGYSIGDLKSTNGGDEIIFGDTDSLYLKSFPGLEYNWSTNLVIPDQTRVVSISGFHSLIIGSNNDDWIIEIIRDYGTAYFCRFVNATTGHYSFYMIARKPINGVYRRQAGQDDLLYGIELNKILFYSILSSGGINNRHVLPSTFFLAPNYPNPFNASTMIEYGLPESGPVKVEIFDILGRKIQTLIDETQSAGYHRVIWNGEDVPSGTYFYRIQAGEKSQTKKCLLLK